MTSKLGFTLFELLVTVVIVSILVSITIANYREYRARAYDVESMTVVRNLETTVIGLIAEGYFDIIGVTDRVNFGHGNEGAWGTDCYTSYGHSNPLLEFHPDLCETAYSWIVTFNQIHNPLLGSYVPESYDIRSCRGISDSPRQYVAASSPSFGRYLYHWDRTNGNLKYFWTR